ncbi:hypothetical protein ABB27_09120 [Stenotrophomonas terrae]|uniref:LuxR family transcriptional regulator n=2 Tax=Stenotrophomonas terrae TaxID=405446 RepID=A0A0R0CQC6_9GAMM|nr:hypothetical protein ABB27_09120 [Stenotrophomonas terrae]
MVGEGVVRLLRDRFDEVQLVLSGEQLLQAARAGGIDIIVTDISMEDMTGIDAMRMLRAEGITTPFVFLSMHHSCAIVSEALRAGAGGYVLKSAAGDELLHAIDEVLAGRVYLASGLAAMALTSSGRGERYTLTDKQRRILDWVAQGLRSKQIAYELGVSVRTVESHKYAIMQLMGVHGTLELVRRAHQLGLIKAFRDDLQQLA